MSQKESLQKLKKIVSDGICFDVNSITYLFYNITYEELLSQKILLKINLSQKLSQSQREQIYKIIINEYAEKKDELLIHIRFLTIFIPIMDDIVNEIKEKLKYSFSNSLQLFLYYLAEYVNQKPDSILLAKNLLISIANETLTNDLTFSKLSTKISFSTISYDAHINVIDYIYKRAIEYGCIYEQFDEISYMRSKLAEVDAFDKPYAKIKISEKDFEKAIQVGSAYSNFLLSKRLEMEPSYIHSYYKCKICRYCKLTKQDEDVEELLYSLLNRQIGLKNTADNFFLLTNSMPSYIMSIIMFLYVELLLLILCTEDNFRIIQKDYLKKNMLFNNHISDEEFKECISLLFNHRYHGIQSSNCFWFICDDLIIIGRWMFDRDFTIIELTNDLAYNLGNSSHYFGKEIFEKLVRNRLEDFKWRVVNSDIRIKKAGTDIDLLAYKNCIVLLGQVKVAHSGRTPYQIWNARKDIKHAKNQIIKAQLAFTDDPNLLYSILKRNKFVSSRNDIVKIVPIIVTSNFYFIDSEDIPSLGFDLIDEFLCTAANLEDDSYFVNAIQNPCRFIRINREPELLISKIETERYRLYYEEYE